MNSYIVTLTTPKLDFIVHNEVKAEDIFQAVDLTKEKYKWAEPLSIHSVSEDPNAKTKKFENQISTVDLTNHQWIMLSMFLRMTQKYRQDERDAWQNLSQQKKEDGAPLYPNAESNTEFWNRMIHDINGMITAIDTRI